MISIANQVSFVPVLIILLVKSSDGNQENNTDFARSKFRDLPNQQFRPENSNTSLFAKIRLNASEGFSDSNLKEAMLRDKRFSKSSHSLASIRKRLNEEKASKTDDLMVLDASPRMEINYTGNVRHAPEPQYGGINTEQVFNRDNDKMRLLYAYRNSEQEVSYVLPGTECNFERACIWKWNDAPGGFFIATPESSDQGPEYDADNKKTGLFWKAKVRVVLG